MKTKLLIISLLLIVAACGGDGRSAPKLISVDPDRICTALGSNLLTITGSGFYADVENGNTGNASVEFPEVRLVGPDGLETALPKDESSLDTTVDPQILTVVVPMNAVEPTGSDEAEITYSVKVVNPNGKSDVLTDALTVFSPTVRQITVVDPPFGWEGEKTAVTILGDGWFVSTPTAYLTATGGTDALPIFLEQTAFIDSSTLTAVVPDGLPLGVYDVTVLNPMSDGSLGILEGGFEVVSEPVPFIEEILPGRGTTQEDTLVEIHGENFRNPVRIELLDESMEIAVSVGGVSPTSANLIETAFPTKTQSQDLPVGVYLVRVVNEDQETYYTYSSFLVTNPAGNLNPFEQTSSLVTARRMSAGVFAKDVNGNRYAYSIGGDAGENGEVFDTLEVSQLSKFGDLGQWRIQANSLNEARTSAAAVAIPVYGSGSVFTPVKTYMYVFGGLSESGEALDSVERAIVLSPDDAPTDLTATFEALAGGLSGGSWYYRVSAVISDGDPDNPSGETQASEEVVVTLLQDSAVTLSWKETVLNGSAAVSYRIYRTDEADGVSKTEHLIAETSQTSYTDQGDDAGTLSPMFPGSTGVFLTMPGTLLSERWGHGALLTTDENGESFVYVAGGKSALAGGVLGSVEWASVDAQGNLALFSAVDTSVMNEPRAFFSFLAEDSSNVSTYPSDGSRIWVFGGIDSSGETISTIEQSEIVSGGGNASWITNSRNVQSAAGTMSVIANDKLFCLGGASVANDTTFSNVTSNGRDTEFDQNGDITNSVNSTANSLIDARAFGAALKGAGFIYFIGGTSTGTDALATCERTF